MEPKQMIVALPKGAEPYAIEKMEAHVKGIRHHAISVFVTCGDAMLIQQRALDKYHCGGLWANACCSHPSPGETADACAERRLVEEMGIALPMQHIGTYEYREPVGNGLWEHEFVDLYHAKVAHQNLQLLPNPEEVAQTRWLDQSALQRQLIEKPEHFTPWFKLYMSQQSAVNKLLGFSH